MQMLQVVFKSRKMCQNKVTMTKRPFILAGGKMKNICQGFFFLQIPAYVFVFGMFFLSNGLVTFSFFYLRNLKTSLEFLGV